MSQMENALDAKMQEYNMLREEMNYYLRIQDTAINTCLTTVTAIIAFGLSQSNHFILLAVHPVLLLFLSRYKRYRKAVMTLSGYMIIFLEPITSFTWETINYLDYLHKYQTRGASFFLSFHHHFWYFMALFALLSSILIDLQLSVQLTAFSYLLYALHIIFVILVIFNSLTIAHANELRNASVKHWREVKARIEDGTYRAYSDLAP